MSDQKDQSIAIIQTVISGLALLVTFFALLGALYIGVTQNSINQKLLDLDSEPNLSIQLRDSVDPKGDSGLQITNNGKWSVDFYEVLVGTTSTKPEDFFVETKESSNIGPGVYITIADLAVTNFFHNIIKAGSDVDQTTNVYVYFKTRNGNKYIMKTWVRVITTPEKGQIRATTYSGPVTYEKFDWKQKSP